jgi:hypothetical protein
VKYAVSIETAKVSCYNMSYIIVVFYAPFAGGPGGSGKKGGGCP